MPFLSPKMYGFIFGFQRLVWWPKCTPASNRSFIGIAFKLTEPSSYSYRQPLRRLALAELEALARASHTVLLAFLGARIARQQPRLAQRRPEFLVELDERAGNTEANRAGLAGDAAACRRREHVKTLHHLGDDERLANDETVSLGREARLERALVDGDGARSRAKKNACGRGLAPAGTVMLCRSQSYATSSLFGFCAACGCSPPA